ncbi:MAG TPA: DUF4062 domain-containing protein [Pyrinomonadaceae bacterium]|nr:DUF4062 domain-containing protein [Pyrinomonadaceae bacterium]
MARPRIFVSSTYYDLKHLRSSLENFIESLGFDAILSEKGDIAYAPDIALDESCYREVNNADIFVIIIGGRYGSEKSETRTAARKQFFDRYDSITKQEYRSALAQDIPIYILIERPVYSDYETYLRNKDNETISYAHVDSVNIFHLIEEILSQPRNNPIQQFDRYSDIEFWLKEQWAGLFRELLTRTSSQKQIASLASQVNELAEVNKTLKTYLEEVVSKIAPEKSAELIKSETERLEESIELEKIQQNPFAVYLKELHDIPYESLRNTLLKETTFEGFLNRLATISPSKDFKEDTKSILNDIAVAKRDLNNIRKILGLKPFEFNSFETNIITPKKRSTKRKSKKESSSEEDS